MQKKIVLITILMTIIIFASSGSVLAELTNEGVNCIAGYKYGSGYNAYFPKWSPDGSKIAYIVEEDENLDIWVSDADGSTKTQLTIDQIDNTLQYGIKWSPYGSKITYIEEKDGKFDIWIMDSDGKNKTQLTTDGLSKSYDWNPYGTKIAYCTLNPSSTEDIYNNIWVMRPDGSNKIQLTTNWNSYNPVWSPDGSKIAFEYYATINPALKIMDSNGGNEIELERLKFDYHNYCFDKDPKWSPGGSKLLFLSNRNETSTHRWNIWIVNPTLNNPKPLTKNMTGSTFSNPVWNQDGSKIAFTIDDKEIWVMDGDGKNEVKLYPDETTFEGYFYNLEWSPDGSKIAFSGKKDSYTEFSTIYVMDLLEVITPTLTPEPTSTIVPTSTPINTTSPPLNITNTSNATSTPIKSPLPTPPETHTQTPPVTTQEPEGDLQGFEPGPFILIIGGILAIVMAGLLAYVAYSLGKNLKKK